MSRPERRRDPRVQTALAVSMVRDRTMFAAQAKNLSASGVYCTLRRFLEPMTKLRLWLEIPNRPQPARIYCQGVVVRVEPPRPIPRRSSYRVAIFFNDLATRDRSIIARYVQQRFQDTT